MADQKNKTPLIIFGFDAGDAPLMRQWADDGSLPTLRSIMDGGSWGTMVGPEMISEHGMWMTLTSGTSRADHGYYYHRQLIPGSYGLAATSGQSIPAEPFWRRLPPEMKIAIIDVPDIAAPTPHAGFEISEWATHYPYHPPSTYPPELLEEVRGIFGPQMVIHEDLASDLQTDRALYAQLVDRIHKKGELCRRLLERDAFDLIFIVFTECHTGGHQFWNYHRRMERADGGETSETGDLALSIRNIYQAIDSEIGQILERLPKKANVFALSSVGMKSQFPASGFNDSICQSLGYQATPTENVGGAGGGLMPLLRRMIPGPVRDQLSRLLPRHTQEQWISDKYASSTDWTRTDAFYIPSYYTGFIRVNLKGREPSGSIEPGRQYHAVLDRLQADFEKLCNPISGEPAVLDIARSVELFGGDPPATLPDMFIEWAETDQFVERLNHPRMEFRQTRCEFHRGSDHSRLGFLGGSGPAVEALGDIGEIDPLDLAPTFLALLGIEDRKGLRGKPILQNSRTATQ